MKQKQIKLIAKATLAVMALTLVLLPSQPAQAAQITSFSDVLTRLKAATVANHELRFAIPGGISAGNVLTLTMTGFDATSVDAIAFGDVDFGTGNSGTCSSATYTEQTLAATASGSTWGVDSDGSNHITITSDSGTSTAGNCVRIRIGTNAVTGTTGTNQILNGAAATPHGVTAAVNNAGSDSGILSIDIITDDQVSITATVDPTITFSISDNTVGFGVLSSTTGRWATGDTNGTNASSPATPNSAHNLVVATNAAAGYVITYNGPTLTASVGTITAASVSSDSDGTQGTEQFALSISTNGTGTIASGYARGTTSSWNFIPSTTTTLISKTSPADTETIDVSYLANIAGSTEAGAYSTLVTYIATGTF